MKTVNQDRLGGGRLDGRATSKGQVFSLSRPTTSEPAVGEGPPRGSGAGMHANGAFVALQQCVACPEASLVQARALAPAVLADPESFSFAP